MIEVRIPFIPTTVPLFIVDGAALLFGAVFSLLGTVALLYSHDYMKRYNRQSEYYFMTVFLVSQLMGLAFARNLILMYLFWEMATFATWKLVGFHQGNAETSIANKTFIMIFAGSSFMLLGFTMLYADTHTFDLVRLRTFQPNYLVLMFIFLGIITKAAILPVHNWLPDAHTVAPSPVSALLSGIVVKIGFLAFLRIFIWTFHTDWSWIPILAIISSIVAAACALLETDMKRIIAYSTVSQMGFILLGFSTLSKIGLAAGLVYFMVHAICKAGLFFCAGIVEQKCGERDISRLGGLMKSLPVTGTAFAFCALSIIGLPPFGGFFGKFMVIDAVARTGQYWIAGLAILAAILTMLYLVRLFHAVFLGKSKFPGLHEGSKVMVGCALFMGALSLISGLFIGQILRFIDVIVVTIFTI
ncbi:complex I subunit 5 family protein [bacterium]